MEAVALKMYKEEDDDDSEGRESKLMDRYERMTFEIQLNKAIHFGRSLSQPHISTPTISSSNASSVSTNNKDITPPPPLPPFTILREKEKDVHQAMPTGMMSSRSSTSSSNGQRHGFKKALKKLLKPVLWRKKSNSPTTSTDGPSLNAAQLSNHNTISWKKFSRSLRV